MLLRIEKHYFLW